MLSICLIIRLPWRATQLGKFASVSCRFRQTGLQIFENFLLKIVVTSNKLQYEELRLKKPRIGNGVGICRPADLDANTEWGHQLYSLVPIINQ